MPAKKRLKSDSQHSSSSYPKPQKVGGRLIREVVSFLRAHGFELPFSSHILIAVSGGPDSIALAHLLIKYGRRVVDRERLMLLHVNHGWRGESSDQDARFVENFAREWNIPLLQTTLTSPQNNSVYDARSWEEVAREARKKFFKKMAEEKNALVLTAHQADDLAETVLWRLLTGTSDTHGGGIQVRHQNEVRPLLGIRKAQLLDYLHEENQTYRNDETNLEGRFLRSRIRTEIMPAIESVFPKAVQHLMKLGLDAQAKRDHLINETGLLKSLFGMAGGEAEGIKVRRAHWDAILQGSPEVHLPDGWKLKRETRKVKIREAGGRKSGKSNSTQQAQERIEERWMLERIFDFVSERNGKEKGPKSRPLKLLFPK